MGAEAARVDALAAREVWKALSVPDRIGVTEERVGPCQRHPNFTPIWRPTSIGFLLGMNDGKPTEFLRSEVRDVDRAKWIPWETPELK